MSYGMDGWNHDNDLVRRKDVMDSLVKEYNRRFSLGERNGLKLAWIEKAVNEVDVAQQGKIQLPEEDATKGATSDLISRAAAIDELNKGAWGVEWDKTLAKTMIESLPSAQPDTGYSDGYADGYKQGLKDAQPIRHGHWLRTGRMNVYGGFEVECSLCHDSVMITNIEYEHYCRNCGARMDEEEAEPNEVD